MIHKIRFAVIDSNILTCIGMQHLLTDLLPMAEIVICDSVAKVKEHEDPDFLHYFVSSRLYFENTAFFQERIKKTIVLVNGNMSIANVHTLNICQPETTLVRDIMALQDRGHGYAMTMARSVAKSAMVLTTRETEIAVLLCKGMISKEIADRLCLSITTVNTHRKNIMEKLHARSLADIIMYCIVNGFISMEELK